TAPEFKAAMEKRLQEDVRDPNAKLGRYVRMPKAHPGSPAYYQEKFAEIMTIARHEGKGPTFFMTLTFDPNTEEIRSGCTERKVKGALPKFQSIYDRPDIMCQTFIEKSGEFIRDLKEKKRFGEITSYAIVLEHQKRGPPHIHCLFFVAEGEGVDQNSPLFINTHVSAEIPSLPQPDD